MQSGCVCRHVTHINTHTYVSIFQHPQEERHHKGSGRLLHLCLPNSELIVSETLPESLSKPDHTPVLLYPASTHPSPKKASQAEPAATTPNDFLLSRERKDQTAKNKIQLIILDGTWRKSRKMRLINPWLQTLPTLTLPLPLPPSSYHIRKAETDQQLSTFEATVIALDLLEPKLDITRPLAACFNGFVEQIQCDISIHARK